MHHSANGTRRGEPRPAGLNDVGYAGPLSVEWEDSRMDREHGATEAAAFVKRVDFPPSRIAFDAHFDRRPAAPTRVDDRPRSDVTVARDGPGGHTSHN